MMRDGGTSRSHNWFGSSNPSSLPPPLCNVSEMQRVFLRPFRPCHFVNPGEVAARDAERRHRNAMGRREGRGERRPRRPWVGMMVPPRMCTGMWSMGAAKVKLVPGLWMAFSVHRSYQVPRGGRGRREGRSDWLEDRKGNRCPTLEARQAHGLYTIRPASGWCPQQCSNYSSRVQST